MYREGVRTAGGLRGLTFHSESFSLTAYELWDVAAHAKRMFRRAEPGPHCSLTGLSTLVEFPRYVRNARGLIIAGLNIA